MTDLHEMADTLRRHPSRIQEYTMPYMRQVWGTGRSTRECYEWSKLLFDEYEWQDNDEKAAMMRDKIKHYGGMVKLGVVGMSSDPQLEACITELFPLYSNSVVSTNVGLKHEA